MVCGAFDASITRMPLPAFMSPEVLPFLQFHNYPYSELLHISVKIMNFVKIVGGISYGMQYSEL